ncbi:MAG: triose-phosphate isomerase [Nitrospirota bacterium]
MRKPVLIANWKMNKTITEGRSFVDEINCLIKDIRKGDFSNRLEVIIAPSFTALSSLAYIIDEIEIGLAAQNMHWEDKGAYTGEISPQFLEEIGCGHVIIGHSERRHIFKENSDIINKKIIAALRHKISPVFCVGERLEERESGKTFKVIEKELTEGLKGISKEDINNIMIAYEPVWAIGTGKNATPRQANEVHLFIRKKIGSDFGTNVASSIRILYGGSVTPDNIEELIAEDEIDGALIGGASLKAESFAEIIRCVFEKRSA